MWRRVISKLSTDNSEDLADADHHIIYPTDGGRRSLWNADTLLPVYMAPHISDDGDLYGHHYENSNLGHFWCFSVCAAYQRSRRRHPVFHAKFCSPTWRVGTSTAYGDYGLLGCDAVYTDRFRHLLSIWQQVPPKRWYYHNMRHRFPLSRHFNPHSAVKNSNII